MERSDVGPPNIWIAGPSAACVQCPASVRKWTAIHVFPDTNFSNVRARNSKWHNHRDNIHQVVADKTLLNFVVVCWMFHIFNMFLEQSRVFNLINLHASYIPVNNYTSKGPLDNSYSSLLVVLYTPVKLIIQLDYDASSDSHHGSNETN